MDALVVGGGLIGLSAARGIAAEGLKVALIGRANPGEASPAAAGMLAPSVERSGGPAHAFAVASRDRFPRFLEAIAEETGIQVPLNRLGVLQLAVTPAGVKGLKKSVQPGAEWISASDLHKLEPSLSHGLGAVFSPLDGCVDNTLLLQALRAVAIRKRIEMIDDHVLSISPSPSYITVATESGDEYRCERIVIAPGAWISRIGGVRFGKSVRPSRGQMLSYDAAPLRHVVYGPRGYLVPREAGKTLAGSTMEDVGFESQPSPEGIAKVRSAAAEICPSLGRLEPARSWAGLRPVTPDLLPLLGPDPADARIVYACGHSRNGVLLAPLTGEVVTDLVVGRGVGFDLMQFRPDRFQY